MTEWGAAAVVAIVVLSAMLYRRERAILKLECYVKTMEMCALCPLRKGEPLRAVSMRKEQA